jgi:putative ABC transport system permease protein
MFWSYVTSAMRNVARHKLYSFINITGLVVGLACATFILLFLRDEFSYDAWIPESENLYRVESTYSMPGRDPDFFSVTPFPVTTTMQLQIPEVVAHTHLTMEAMTAQIGDRQFPVQIDAVDPNFFQLIKLPFAEGNPATAIARPDSIVLSQATARKFFGTTDPLDKNVLLGGSYTLKVTGILRDLPHNTQLTADLVMPNNSKADTLPPSVQTSWLNVNGWGYVQLAPQADLDAVMTKLKPMLDRNIDVRKQLHANMQGSDVLHLHLTPFRDVHLARFGEKETGRWGTVYGFAAIAVLILLIACINYMNLATARATVRAREVSLRKVMGAKRSQLIVQFIAESVITALVAVGLAFAMVEILLPAFDSLLARPISLRILADWPLILVILAVALAAGTLGGIYPAFVLSSFRPAARLGTSAAEVSGSGLLRTALVVLQFAISIGLGIAVLVIFAQINFNRQIDLGFDRHNLVVINGTGSLTPSALDSMVQALAAEPSIAGAAQSNLTPLDGGILVTMISMPGSRDTFEIRNNNIDPNFVNVYGMKLLAGRNLSRQRGEDIAREHEASNPNPAYNILINEAAARQFGYTPQSAIGHTIIHEQTDRATIVGVVGDANFDGLERAMQPFIYFYDPKHLGPISVRVKPGQNQAALAAMDRIWHRFMPMSAIRRRFQEDSFDRLFVADEREGRIFSIFVSIAIFIACLGLLGLASFTAERRTREIGIRKVFGARTRDIVWLLLWQFSIPVLIANLIAWPVAWYFLRHWLQGYAYKIDLSPLYFLTAGILALVIAWLTVIIHTVIVARANPIHALRYE